MKHKTISFEEKIKTTFTKHARILMTILFIVLALFIGFEQVIKPQFNAYRTNKSITTALEELEYNIKDVMDNMRITYDVSVFFESYYSKLISKGIKGDISVYDEQGKILFITNPSDEGSVYNKTFNRFFVDNIEESPNHKISSSTTRNTDRSPYNDLVYGEKIARSDDSLVYVIIYIDSAWLMNYVEDRQPNLVVITDKQHHTLATTSSSVIDKYNRFNIKGSSTIKLQEREYKVMESVNKTLDLKVHVLSYMVPLPNFLGYVAITYVIILLIHQYVSSKVAARVGREAAQSISNLTKMINKVAQGELGATVQLDTMDEFDKLGLAFNEMSLALKETTKRNTMLIELQKSAEIKQLEAQFNPHFLYNSLETIRYLIAAEPKLAETLILKNTQLLRYSIESKDELVLFKDDFDFIRVFLGIHQIRLGDALLVTIDVDEALYDEMLPKLILLPLIENSIKYGFRDQETLSITITGKIKGNALILSVIDDGSGMDEATLKHYQSQYDSRLSSGSHYGLYSIHHRLNLIYKKEARMTIQSKESGTSISLIIPRRSNDVQSSDS